MEINRNATRARLCNKEKKYVNALTNVLMYTESEGMLERNTGEYLDELTIVKRLISTILLFVIAYHTPAFMEALGLSTSIAPYIYTPIFLFGIFYGVYTYKVYTDIYVYKNVEVYLMEDINPELRRETYLAELALREEKKKNKR